MSAKLLGQKLVVRAVGVLQGIVVFAAPDRIERRAVMVSVRRREQLCAERGCKRKDEERGEEETEQHGRSMVRTHPGRNKDAGLHVPRTSSNLG
jgi:hypothetical protein